jgi:peptidyl-prolyl cis-trans isomerase C/peptidyl-prolyl cis-trans isomerase SurA
MRIAPLLPGLFLLLGCAKLTAPASEDSSPTIAAAQPEPAPKPPEPAPAPTREREEPDERVAASHILVSYKGSERAKPAVTRTKAEALERAKEIQAKAAKGDDFAKLAQKYSDGPSGPRGGELGKFSKQQMVKPFSDAAFALKPGAVSDVVETKFGFHVIKRTE